MKEKPKYVNKKYQNWLEKNKEDKGPYKVFKKETIYNWSYYYANKDGDIIESDIFEKQSIVHLIRWGTKGLGFRGHHLYSKEFNFPLVTFPNHSHFENCRFKSRFKDVNFDFNDFVGCEFFEFDFENVKTQSCRFVDCIFNYCSFHKTEFINATFKNCMFIECEFYYCEDELFSGASLLSCEFQNVLGLTRSMMKLLKSGKETLIPAGLHLDLVYGHEISPYAPPDYSIFDRLGFVGRNDTDFKKYDFDQHRVTVFQKRANYDL